MDILFGQRVAATDDWVGAVEGVVLLPDTLQVSRIVTRHGFWNRSEVDISIDLISNCDHEGVDLNVSKQEATKAAQNYTEDSENSVELFDTTYVSTDRSSLKLKGVRIGDDDHVVSALILHERGNEDYVVAIDRFAEIGTDAIVFDISESDIDELPMYRIDSDIQIDVWEDLSNAEDVPDVDLAGVRVDVYEGNVTISGNVRLPEIVDIISDVALSVVGVLVVDNQLASDWDIILAAAATVSHNAPELAGSVSFHSQLGVLNVYGNFDSVASRNEILANLHDISGVIRVVDETAIRVPVAVPVSADTLGEETEEVSEEQENSPAQ